MHYESDLPREARELLQNILLRGEELRWTGTPIPYYFEKGTAFILLFGTVWTAMSSVFTAFTFMAEDFPVEAMFILIPFILIGLCLMSTPLFTHRKTKRTFYALTNKRAIVVVPGLFSGNKIHHFDLEDDVIKEQQVKNDGSGDIIFGYEEAYRQNHTPVMRGVGFVNLPNMKAVEERIYNLMAELKQTSQEN